MDVDRFLGGVGRFVMAATNATTRRRSRRIDKKSSFDNVKLTLCVPESKYFYGSTVALTDLHI